MDESEADVPACMTFALTHRTKPHSLDPLEGSMARASGAPTWPASSPTQAVTRLVGALLLQQSDERAARRTRHVTLETIATPGEDMAVSPPTLAA